MRVVISDPSGSSVYCEPCARKVVAALPGKPRWPEPHEHSATTWVTTGRKRERVTVRVLNDSTLPCFFCDAEPVELSDAAIDRVLRDVFAERMTRT